MSDFRARDYLAPRYWLTWLGLALLWLLGKLPFPLIMALGSAIGRLVYWLLPSRRHVVRTNLRLCFPALSDIEREQLVKRNFAATGIAALEGGLSWWGSERALRRRYHIEGLEHIEAAKAAGKGVLLIGGHFVTLEMSGHLLAFHDDTVNPIYKPASNPLFNAVMVNSRKRLFDDLLENADMRTIIRALKKQKVVWYAPDQDFGRHSTVFAPFFGVPTATLTTTARLAKLSGAVLLPFYSQRTAGNRGYEVKILPPLEGFPSGDDVADATRLNRVLEELIALAPEQYLWAHKRFKTRPAGEPHRYKR